MFDKQKALQLIFAAVLPGVFSLPRAVGAEISVAEQVAAAGGTVIAPVLLDAQGNQISGVQFDIAWDGAALEAAVVAGNQPRLAGKNVYLTMLGPNSLRCLLVGFNQQAFAAGEVLKLFLFVHSAAAPGSYEVKLSGAIATDSQGQPIPLNSVMARVNVQSGATVNNTILPAGGVMNAASLVPGPVAPGEIISLVGPGTAMLSGNENAADLSVALNGARAPLLYTGTHQINAVVPFSVASQASINLEVRAQNRRLAGLTVPVIAAMPGLFTQDASGMGPAAVLNEDSSVNTFSNPANRGSIVMFYGTGFGTTNPPGVDGEAAAGRAVQTLPVTATIGGREADIIYAGAAPGLIAGVAQINVRVPVATPAGVAVPVVLRAGTAPTQGGVTLSVR